jgi:tRNA-2-methylthio-N6-dimethylallyladenosine synthase
VQNRRTANMAELLKKEIDETIQGTAIAPQMGEELLLTKKFYIESYGCAMNFSDSEIVASILKNEGFGATTIMEEADLLLINTCSIRDKAEQTVRNRLHIFRREKKKKAGALIGVLGCMAERLKAKLLEEEKLVDMVIGPDAYRSLPALIKEAESGQKGINVLLSREETYADISPVRLDNNGVSAFVSIMRGCNNMCTFCVVPFTRGRERSRDAESILQECKALFEEGYKEITLLGQNVDSYHFTPEHEQDQSNSVTFAMLLEKVALIDSKLRVRFSTSHPKDITDDVLHTMAKYRNICKCIHLPVQSGNTRILQMMNRTYTREWYLSKVKRIKEIMSDCDISTDVIIGFCSETEEEHQDTLSLMDQCKFSLAYMYTYSERPGTLAERRYEDDVPEEVKKRRIEEVIAMYRGHSFTNYQASVGQTFEVLIEATSKRSEEHWSGRNSQNKVVVFAKENYGLNKGDYVMVKITSATSGTLLGEITAVL